MALIKCKECGAQISDKAEACPKCGYRTGVKFNNNIVPSQMTFKEQSFSNNQLSGEQQDNKTIILKYLNNAAIAVGLCILIFGIYAITGDSRYTYEPPFTDHEMHNLMITGAGAIIAGIGIDIKIKLRRK